MFNNVTMMGRIVNDLELKVTPNGTNYCAFRIAVERRYQTKGEERKTDFFNVVAWRKAAEFITKWFAKGRMILVQGELQTRQYTDKNGNPATWYEIITDHISFTGEKKLDADNAPTSLPPEPPQAASSEKDAMIPEEPAAVDDDYPF